MSAAPIFTQMDYAAKSPFVDLSPYLDGEITPILPTVAEVWPGRCLFYAAAVNEIHAEPSVGKTNILLAAAGRVLEAGGTVFFLDPEDTPARIIPRAIALGVDRGAMRERFRYIQDPSPDDYAEAHQWAEMLKPDLVILDGLAEALAAEGKDENNPADNLTFFRERIRPFTKAGAGVVIADHVTKSTEGRGRWARGSGAKLGHYNGASYEIALGESYTPTKPGFVRLKVSKDRNGGVGPMGANVAELHFAPGEAGSTITTWQDAPAPGSFRPTAIMDKITAHLRAHGEATKTELRELGKAEYVDKAIGIMIAESAITRRKDGQAHRFSLVEETPAEP